MQFEDEKEETDVDVDDLESPKLNTDLNDYEITVIELEERKTEEKIGIRIHFQRNPSGINGILINYHIICGTLVMVSSTNYLIEPKDPSARAGELIAIFIVLATYFTAGQVKKILQNPQF